MKAVILMLVLVLAACQPQPSAPIAAGTFGPDLVERQKALCESRGGRWGRGGGLGTSVCYETPRTANQPCATAQDCDGLCLARSRTCAPVRPFFGCHEVFTASGTRATQCIE